MNGKTGVGLKSVVDSTQLLLGFLVFVREKGEKERKKVTIS